MKEEAKRSILVPSSIQIRSRLFKIVLTLMLAVLLISTFTAVVAGAATIYVPDGYPTIQKAVYKATAGDTIIVRDGTYDENVIVNKSLTIRSENGAANCIVQATASGDNVFRVIVNYVSISGFTVKWATGTVKAGIYLDNVNHCNISNNIGWNNRYTIYLYHSSHNVLSDNTCNVNTYYDIALYYSSHNTLQNNICNDGGIQLYDSSDNTVSNNTNGGIQLLYWCNNNTISDNTCTNGVIDLRSSSDNAISDNTCTNGYICLIGSSNNNITGNTASGEPNGIQLYYRSNNNIISNNTCYGNTFCGIHLDDRNYNNTISGNNLLRDQICRHLPVV